MTNNITNSKTIILNQYYDIILLYTA